MNSSDRDQRSSAQIARVLAEIARLLESPDNQDERLHCVLKAVGELVPYQSCALLIERSDEATLLAMPEPAANSRPALQSSLWRLLHAMKGNGETVSSSIEANRLVLPVIAADRVIGLLRVEGGEAYELEDVQLLSAVASQLGTYLTMVDLTAREREARKEAERLHSLLADKAKHLEELVQERTGELRASIAELESFAYSLSHDMRAPLRAIQSFSQAVMEDYGKDIPPTGIDYLKKMVSASARMDRLIQEVLAFSRLSRQQITLQPIDVEKLLREIIQERPEFQTAQVDIEIQSPLLSVLGHDASLTQCITNLLSNAVKFVNRGVKPRVRIWSEAMPPADGPPMRWVRLWFEDNGIGIDKEAQRRLFGLFQRLHPDTEYQGIGIGLAIVRKAVERMGGSVGVESERGKGSRFWIQLQGAES
jgi:signal transduction histidine kinase